MTHLLLTVRFLDDRYHGLLGRGGPPEWPPSPFRLFQAIVAGVARRSELVDGDDVPSNTNFTPIGEALGWLQRHTREHPPIIIAPKSKTGQAITRFVPNNDGDKKFDRQERLTAKPTIPTLFILEDGQKPEVHYVWEVNQEENVPERHIRDAARALTSLGWGIDMAFADARTTNLAELESLQGIRWYPKENVGSFNDTLRTPTYDAETKECTLCDLRQCHSTFINRIEQGKPLKIVDKPKVFDRVLYTSVERPIRLPYRVFRLVDADDNPYRYSHAKLIHIAGMVRHAALKAMDVNKGYPPPSIRDDEKADWVNRVVRGKRNNECRDDHKQFSYIPLPSIGVTHADAMIRNVMIVAPLDLERELNHLYEQLDGVELQPEGEAEGYETDTRPEASERIFIQQFPPPSGKFIDLSYLGNRADGSRPRVWHSVTPVILPGHNDHKPEKTIKLIRSALAQSGIETPCTFTWQAVPFLKNTLSAHKYRKDEHGNKRRAGYFFPTKGKLRDYAVVHLRLTFSNPVAGPIVIGAGRHCGFGLFAALAE